MDRPFGTRLARKVGLTEWGLFSGLAYGCRYRMESGWVDGWLFSRAWYGEGLPHGIMLIVLILYIPGSMGVIFF